ncbi:MAG: hypothetical protein IPK07_12205 [Deltaproteobacteria bacterium]|nr:hypothetical protein [Deltaproteobacteria bacterium]
MATRKSRRTGDAAQPDAAAKPAKQPVKLRTPTRKRRRVGSEPLDEETLAALSAAVAAYLGHTARIRHVRLIHRAGPSLWTQTARQGVQTAWAALRSAPHREVR